jgi:PKD repeat protein
MQSDFHRLRKRIFLLTLAVIAAFLLARGTAAARVVISEVFWVGSSRSTADEWLELTSVYEGSGSSIDMSGWLLSTLKSSGEEQIIYRFLSGATLGSGDILLISNYDADQSSLEVEPNIVTTAVSLLNQKLLITLKDASGSIIDQADDGTGAPFAGGNNADSGLRTSMERIDLMGAGDDPANWEDASTFIGIDSGALILATPGSRRGTGSSASILIPPTDEETDSGSTIPPNPKPIPRILITEVLPNPIGRDDEEWIELTNFSTGSVTLASWILDNGEAPGRYTIPPLSSSGFILAPAQRVSLRKSETGLTLRNSSGTVVLSSGSIIIDQVDYPVLPEGVSYGRKEGEFESMQPFCVPSEGRINEEKMNLVSIGIQSQSGTVTGSGTIVGEGKVSVNLEARVASGSIASITCNWDYGDGYSNQSCNPASHTFKEEGTYNVVLEAQDYCVNTVQQTLSIQVLEKRVESIGGGGSSENQPIDTNNKCVQLNSSGVRISEVFPNPYGDEALGEWIEIQNVTDQPIALCGWSMRLCLGREVKKLLSIKSASLHPSRESHTPFARMECGRGHRIEHRGKRIISGAPSAGTLQTSLSSPLLSRIRLEKMREESG